ncbi:MAG: hypothetical protein FWD34_03615 [Oscillospiraceae bacterium]|nr:hypothetical protein [Oscillospiraceae bacterium]
MTEKLPKSKSAITVRIIWFLVILFFIITLISQIVLYFYRPLKTEIALYYETTEYVLFKGVYIRNETQISYPVNGIVAYTYKDGEKIAINSTVAKIYNTHEEIFIQQRIHQLEAQIKELLDAETFAGTDNSQLEAFLVQISDKHLQMLSCIDDGDYEKAAVLKNEYLNLQSKLNIIKGTATGYSEKINAIRTEIEQLKNSISSEPRDLIIAESGYFVSSADGYEDILRFDNALNTTKEQIEEILKNPSLDVPDGVVGKIIDDYKWRMVAILDADEAFRITNGSTVNLRIGTSTSSIKATVVSTVNLGDGTMLCIFESDIRTDEFGKKRTVSVRLLLDDYSGIRISHDAVRFNEAGESGVFILNGSLVEFKKINQIRSTEDYIIVELKKEPGYLKPYDKVIVSGKDLYDGKIIS